MQSPGEFSSASHPPTRCTDGAEGITKLKNSDRVVHIKYRTYSTSWCAGEEIFLPKETCHLDKDVLSVFHECLQHHLNTEHVMSSAVMLEGTSWFIFHQGLILLCLVPVQGRSHSSEVLGVKETFSKSEPQCCSFFFQKKLLTAKPTALPVQLIFSENHSYQFGLYIFMDNYKTLLQLVWLSWQQAISLCTKLWPKYLTYKQGNKNCLLPTSKALLTTSVVFYDCTSITSYQVTCKWINKPHSMKVVIG